MSSILNANTGLGILKAEGSAPRAELPQVTGTKRKKKELKCSNKSPCECKLNL